MSSVFGIVLWRKDAKQKLKEEHQQTLYKRIENDVRMKALYRDSSSVLAGFKGDIKTEIYLKKVSDIKDDDVRMCIFQIIDILSDVYFFYQISGHSIEDSIWLKNFQHCFNPKEMIVFVSAFRKYQSENQFSDEFISFVNKIINQNPGPNSSVIENLKEAA